MSIFTTYVAEMIDFENLCNDALTTTDTAELGERMQRIARRAANNLELDNATRNHPIDDGRNLSAAGAAAFYMARCEMCED